MTALKVNGYTIIASLRAWQEWSVYLNAEGEPHLNWLENQQDDVSGNTIEEWTFEGGEYGCDDYSFATLEEVIAFVQTLEQMA